MSPRTNEQLENLRKESRSKILMAALELFATDGYHNTSVGKVAKHAGVSKGLMYNYFDSKESLLKEVVLLSLSEGSELAAEMIGGLAKLKTKKEIFSFIIDQYFEQLVDKKELWKLTLTLAVQVSSLPFIHDTITQAYQGLLGQLEQVFVMLEAENPKEEATLLGAHFDGIGIQYMIFGEDYPLEEIKKNIIGKYCKD